VKLNTQPLCVTEVKNGGGITELSHTSSWRDADFINPWPKLTFYLYQHSFQLPYLRYYCDILAESRDASARQQLRHTTVKQLREVVFSVGPSQLPRHSIT
jgi:hypothetical protein